MKKIFHTTLISLISLLLLSTSLVGCEKIDVTEETNTQNITGETNIQNVFIINANHGTDNNYRFQEYDNVGNVAVSYCFTYSPEKNLYNASLMVITATTSGTPRLYDYASITFSWGKFKNALFYAYHELESVAKIEFEYKVLSYNDNIGDKYNYSVKSNTFSKLTEKDDIEDYANNSYDCLKQIVPFIKRTLKKYNVNTDLW